MGGSIRCPMKSSGSSCTHIQTLDRRPGSPPFSFLFFFLHLHRMNETGTTDAQESEDGVTLEY